MYRLGYLILLGVGDPLLGVCNQNSVDENSDFQPVYNVKISPKE